MTLTMTGPILGRHVIAARFEAHFPALLRDLRVEWGLDEADLPDPVKYLPRAADAIDQFPMLAVSTGVESTTRRIEHDAEGGKWRSTYPIEVYLWTVADGVGASEDMRDRMSAAVKIFLLGDQTFGGSQVGLDEDTFTQAYSDITKTRGGDRYVAGSQSAFDLIVFEGLEGFGATLRPRVDTVGAYGVSDGSPFATQPTPIVPPPVHPSLE